MSLFHVVSTQNIRPLPGCNPGSLKNPAHVLKPRPNLRFGAANMCFPWFWKREVCTSLQCLATEKATRDINLRVKRKIPFAGSFGKCTQTGLDFKHQGLRLRPLSLWHLSLHWAKSDRYTVQIENSLFPQHLLSGRRKRSSHTHMQTENYIRLWGSWKPIPSAPSGRHR